MGQFFDHIGNFINGDVIGYPTNLPWGIVIMYEKRFERAYGFCRPYLRSVIYRYLDCGILRNGFARVQCGECGHEYLLAFVLKRIGNPASAGQASSLLPTQSSEVSC